MKELHEQQFKTYNGTIIDFETTGDLIQRVYPKYDSREFSKLKACIVGIINKNSLDIYCAEGLADINNLRDFTKPLFEDIFKNGKPVSAFNCHFETGVLYNQYDLQVSFDNELQPKEYTRKEDTLQSIGNTNDYSDPFSGKPKAGMLCREAWENNQLELAMKHNRACLLKEQFLFLNMPEKKPIAFNFSKDINDIPTAVPQTFKYWDYKEENQLRDLWNKDNTISSIATTLNRSPKAIWMRLQKFGIIPNNNVYDNTKNNTKNGDLK
jgi:hypothetical protein